MHHDPTVRRGPLHHLRREPEPTDDAEAPPDGGSTDGQRTDRRAGEGAAGPDGEAATSTIGHESTGQGAGCRADEGAARPDGEAATSTIGHEPDGQGAGCRAGEGAAHDADGAQRHGALVPVASTLLAGTYLAGAWFAPVLLVPLVALAPLAVAALALGYRARSADLTGGGFPAPVRGPADSAQVARGRGEDGPGARPRTPRHRLRVVLAGIGVWLLTGVTVAWTLRRAPVAGFLWAVAVMFLLPLPVIPWLYAHTFGDAVPPSLADSPPGSDA